MLFSVRGCQIPCVTPANRTFMSGTKKKIWLTCQHYKGKVFSGQWDVANRITIWGLVIKQRNIAPGISSWIWEGIKNLGTAKVIKIPDIKPSQLKCCFFTQTFLLIFLAVRCLRLLPEGKFYLSHLSLSLFCVDFIYLRVPHCFKY